VVGNRPQFVKAAAVSGPLRAVADEVLVHSGQHHDPGLSDVFFTELALPRPDEHLGISGGDDEAQVERMVDALLPLMAEHEPNWVLVYGDTNTTLAGAIAADRSGFPVAHVEAGMRSFDPSMPEERNRIATDRLSALLLCSTPVAVANAMAEDLPGTVELVGDVMADVVAMVAPRVAGRTVALDELGLEATLRNGLLTVGRLAAGVYDGSVELAGTIDATRDSLGIDLKGNLRGVDLGQLLRGTAGRNSFGNDSLMLAVDGKVDITDFAIQGGGGSVDELRDALVGRGRIGGHLDTKVASGSLGLASFATGLGSIFSTELGFGSAMLAGFVNHQSALAGDLGLANSVVSLRKQTIRGHNALASIDSDINLREGVTDTTVRLDVGVTDTIDYVFTVKGPLSAPVFATRGGTARDSQPRDIQSKDAQPQDPPAQAPPRK